MIICSRIYNVYNVSFVEVNTVLATVNHIYKVDFRQNYLVYQLSSIWIQSAKRALLYRPSGHVLCIQKPFVSIVLQHGNIW